MKKKILVIVLCVACVAGYAQKRKRKTAAKKPAQSAASATQTAVDTTQKQQVASSKPGKPFVTPYANLRESDVVYAKRVWREIDTREKMNQFLSSPKGRLIDVFMDAIAAGELTAYDATPGQKGDVNGDEFSKPLTAAQARNKMADSTVVDKFDKNGDKVGSTLVAGEFNPDSVVKFRIKEDWVFDKQRSVFEPRIVGIAPMVRVNVGGVKGDFQPAFWIYFPDARQILTVKEVVSRNSDATGLSFDDIFMKRMFSSYIVKISNDKDERIKDYAQGIDKLYEAERIKKNLMDWELNLWSY
jgi:gliding motility associated protien GldN